MRKITVYSSQGKSGVTIETDVTTYGQLKPLLVQNGFKHDGMNSIISETENLLATDDSILMDGDFTLIMTPKKTKAGADLSRSECYTAIKDFIAAGVKKENFSVDGKNYTNLPTDVLRKMVEKEQKKADKKAGNTTATPAVTKAAPAKTAATTSKPTTATAKAQPVTLNGLIAQLRTFRFDNPGTDDTFESAVDEIETLVNEPHTIDGTKATPTTNATPKESDAARKQREVKEAQDRAAQAKIDKFRNITI